LVFMVDKVARPVVKIARSIVLSNEGTGKSTTTAIHLRDQLQDAVSGSVLSPDDVGYDAARTVYNGLIDRRPALIVRAQSADDVVAGLTVAREAGLEVSVRGGGHNVAGRAVTEGGVMIDLAEMKRITIDPERRTATAGGGVRWAELNAAAGAHGWPLLEASSRPRASQVSPWGAAWAG
jgi:FAD/FMN-containing dehydrogenase